jgi:hypothetical protein
MKMKIMSAFLLGAALCVSTQAQAGSNRDKMIGAWRLVSLQAPGPDGQLQAVPGLTGTLIYTRDGHMSVQLMYPDSTVTNDYVLNGYEASFGSFDVNPSAHTVTHHVRGSVTRGLVGKDLTRRYRLEGSRLIIRSTRADESWQVTWEHE